VREFARTPRQQMRLLSTRGLIAAQHGDLDDAAEAHEEALALAAALGNAYWRMVAMLNLAEIEHRRGSTARAIALAREAVPEAAQRLGPNAFVHLLNKLAGYLLAVDDLPAARASARESLARLVDVDPKSGLIAGALEHLALALALEGETGRAALVFGYCEAAYAAVGYLREFTERTSSERLQRLLDERLGAGEVARLRAKGVDLTVQGAIEEATRGQGA
jgi:ATP/maltotriose-dependent transcriptional regulator MalT